MKAAKQGRAKPAARRDSGRELVSLLRRMWVIRAFEEKVSALYAARKIVGLLHLGIGQEAVAVGVCSELDTDDSVFGGHRSHGHAIAKGADVNRLMAELAGRATGYCRGKGGSMHVVAAESGFVTATGVVGVRCRWPSARHSPPGRRAPGGWRWCSSSATAPARAVRSTSP